MHHVDPEGLVPGLLRIADRQCAHVTDQGIDATQCGGAVVHPLGERLAIGHIQGTPECVHAHAFERRHGGRNFIGIARAYRHVRAFGGKALGGCAPDSFATAGDKNTFSLESEVHCISPN